MATKTSLDFLDSEENNENTSGDELKTTNLQKTIFDLSIDLDVRLRAVELFAENPDNDTIDIISRLGAIYEASGAILYRRYLFGICEKTKISGFIKSLAALSLYTHTKDKYSFDAINIVYPQLNDSPTTYKIDVLRKLMESPDHKENANNYFSILINDQKISPEFRYKTIQSLENMYEKNKKGENMNCEKNDRISWFIREALLNFAKNPDNNSTYRIYASQYLLRRFEINQNDLNSVNDFLITFAENNSNEYNLRADAADILLLSEIPDVKTRAQKVIFVLGKNGKSIKNIYQNAQNVHNIAINKSVEKILNFLSSFDIITDPETKMKITFDKVSQEIMKRSEIVIEQKEEKEEKKEKIQIALKRIDMDRALYGKTNCSLSNVLIKLWSYMQKNKNENEMFKRLIEELTEMAGTCSTGFISRLVNVISGFGDLFLTISWREQIIANLNGRLNARIRDMDNLRLRAKILEEMADEKQDSGDKKYFMYFVRENLLPIREELYEEFKTHITDSDFDLYFKAAVIAYQTGSYESFEE